MRGFCTEQPETKKLPGMICYKTSEGDGGGAQDLVYYTRMFAEDMRRDPTNVELFDIAQSNSEHRHALLLVASAALNLHSGGYGRLLGSCRVTGTGCIASACRETPYLGIHMHISCCKFTTNIGVLVVLGRA